MLNPERRSQILSQLSNHSAVVLCNPNAGSPRRASGLLRETRQLVDVLRDSEYGLGLDVTYTETENAQQAEDLVEKAIADENGLLIVKGGDGTIAPIAHQLVEAKHATHLVIVGGGTQNVLRRQLTKHTNPLKVAEEVLLHGHPKKIDIGVMETRTDVFPFVTNAGIGLDAHVLNKWEENGKKSRAQVPMVFLHEKGRFVPYNLAITDNSAQGIKTYEGVAAMVINNGGKYGGWFDVTNSDMTDGVMEGFVVPVSKLRVTEMGNLAYHAVRGHRPIQGISYLYGIRAITIRDTREQELIFHHDGEPKRAESSEIRVSAIPGAVTLWTPAMK
jgi:diacylglycerol kinase family enzyme